MLLERYFVSFLLLLSAFYVIYAFRLPLYSANGMIGAGFFPRMISVILFLLVCWYFIILLRRKTERHEKHEKNTSKRNQSNASQADSSKKTLMQQCILIIFLIACIALTNVIGILPTTGVFMFVMLAAVQRIPWMKSLIFSIAVLIVMYTIFDLWLGIALPKGVFG